MIDEMYIVIMHQKLPRCQISCTLQRGLLTLWLTCTVVQPIMIPRKRITILLSHHNWLRSHRLLLASVLPHWSLSICSCWPVCYTGNHLRLLCPPLVFPGDQSWGLCSFFIYTYFAISSVHSMFNADDINTNLYISFLHQLFSWHIKSNSLIHSLCMYLFSSKITYKTLMILF